ncbi:F-box protein [Sporobolomyces salmoneus]|uniref:F-box protein n=1 Tax=Sporobolomyces salmoneus TaxID=183962 RepID=UPI00316B5795
MSTRSTRQRGRVSYVEAYSDESDAPESAEEVEEQEDDEWSPTHRNKRQRANKGKSKKGKKGKKNDAQSDSSSEGEDDDDEEEEEGDDQEFNGGVNFSEKVPYEIVAEIFSYLSPRELLIFDTSCKSFRSILSGPDSRSIWVKARKNVDIKLPEIDIGDISERQLANLLFNKECENCGKGVVKIPDVYLCKRFCPACRESNWIKIEDIPKNYPDFHAATPQAVAITQFSAKDDRYQGSSSYALYTELHDVNEELASLELLDAPIRPLADEQQEEEDAEDESGEGGASGSTGRKSRSGGRSSRGKVNYAVDSDEDSSTSKKLIKARRFKRYGSRYYLEVAHELEEEVMQSFSPSVKEYLKKQTERHEKWEKVAARLVELHNAWNTILATERKAAIASSRLAVQKRRATIERKLMKKGFKRENFSDEVWTQSSLVNSPTVLGDEEWSRIKKRLKKLAGHSIANQLWQTVLDAARQRFEGEEQVKVRQAAAKRLARLMENDQEEEEGGDVDDDDDNVGEEEASEGESSRNENEGGKKDWKKKLLAKPKSVNKKDGKVWKYVLPHLEKLTSAEVNLAEVNPHSSQKSRRKVEPVERNPLSILTPDQLEYKNNFFKEKYDKIVDMYDTPEKQSLLPLYSRFLHLPTVKDLYYENPLYATQSNVPVERQKADAIWAQKLDEILEEIAQYAVDARVYFVETVLTATGEMDEEEVAKLDTVELLGNVEQGKQTRLVDAAFVHRPSSFVFCGLCGKRFGEFARILEHQHEAHNHRSASLPYSPTRDELFPFELSIQVSIALSALLDVTNVDLNSDRPVRAIKKAVKGKTLVWSNQPPGLGKKTAKGEDWASLLGRIHRRAKAEDEKEGGILAAPVIVLRKKNGREQYQERVARSLQSL